jgi:hypothetical protein
MVTPLPRCALRSLRPLASAIFAGLAATGIAVEPPSTPRVELHREAHGHWQLRRDGAPYLIRGAGGWDQLDRLAAAGGNTIRTWGLDHLELVIDGRTLPDLAHAHGLTLMAGIWVQHAADFDYGDEAAKQRQRDEIRTGVRRFRHHPAILLWGLGNEAEGFGPTTDPRLWQELEILAGIVREEDPTRPIATVIAGAPAHKIRSIQEHFPSLELLGVNAYSGALDLPATLRAGGWEKPYLLTEFGPRGFWEVPKTAWGAPLEPSPRDKMETYRAAYETVPVGDAGRCLGSFVFLWGQKQELTFTWFGMFLPTGEKLPPVDVMTYAWSGDWPANRSPIVERFESTAYLARIAPVSEHTATAYVTDPEDDPLTYEWQLLAEGPFDWGPAGWPVMPPHPKLILEQNGPNLRFRAPATTGHYRLFVIARDGHGGAGSWNFPFTVENQPVPAAAPSDP